MKILTTGRLGKDFYNSIIKNNLGLQIRYVENLNQKDIEWADTLASFAPNDNVNLSSINWIHSFGAGVEGFLARKDLNNKLILSRTVGDLGLKMGEYCLCHILNFTQNSYEIFKNQLHKRWLPLYPSSTKNKTVLLLGTGEMSKGISKILKALRINLIGANNSGASSKYFDSCIRFKEIVSVSKKIDFVINTLPLTNRTENLLDYKFFKLFKDILFIKVSHLNLMHIKSICYNLD